jgi:hypothetical protein
MKQINLTDAAWHELTGYLAAHKETAHKLYAYLHILHPVFSEPDGFSGRLDQSHTEGVAHGIALSEPPCAIQNNSTITTLERICFDMIKRLDRLEKGFEAHAHPHIPDTPPPIAPDQFLQMLDAAIGALTSARDRYVDSNRMEVSE